MTTRTPTVAAIECIHLRFEMPRESTFMTPGGPVDGRLTTLVQVTTDDGRTGIGSAYAHPGMVQVAVEHLTPFLLGMRVDDLETLWTRMHIFTRWFGRKGAAVAAISGLDTALWDLRGQVEGQPVWRLLGASSGRVPAYASGMLYSSPDEVADGCRRAVARGFRRIKVRIGWSWDYDVAVIAAARDAVGPDRDLMIDGTWRYNLREALDVVPVLEEHRAFWFEEPLPGDEIESLAALRQATSVPIACGENEFALHGFRELMRNDCVDIVQADASRAGGITEVSKIAAEAAARGVRFAPHSWCDAVAIVANAHVVAAAPNGITVEIDQTGNRFVEELLGGPFELVDGHIDLGDAPGLGITLDPAAVADMRLADPWHIPNGNYCDIFYGRDHVHYIGDYVGRDGSRRHWLADVAAPAPE